MRSRIAIAVALAAGPLVAGEQDRRIEELERKFAASQLRIRELEERIGRERSTELSEEIETYLQGAGDVGDAPRPQRRLVDISADLLTGGGASSASNETLLSLQDGGHDPRRRGFTLQQLEVSMVGNVDPYFRGEVHVLFFLDPTEGETEVELEEAFLQTLALPGDLQIEAGHFFTEFGRHNPQHPHQWQFVDQPVVLGRFFGPDGQRAPGFRVSWLAPTDFFLEVHLGMQNAEGETMPSFLGNEEVGEERAVAGRPFVERPVQSLAEFVYLVRVETSFDLTEDWTAVFGASGLFGPNATGPDGRTIIYGIDVYLKWRPAAADQGWPFLTFQAEFLGRSYRADAFDDGVDVFARETFDDQGLYAQVIFGWRRPWSTGFRVGYGSGEGIEANGDPLRDDRLRLSWLLAYHPSEYSRLRLQVNYDDADFLPDDEVSVWIVIEIGLGAHPAHTY